MLSTFFQIPVLIYIKQLCDAVGMKGDGLLSHQGSLTDILSVYFYQDLFYSQEHRTVATRLSL